MNVCMIWIWWAVCMLHARCCNGNVWCRLSTSILITPYITQSVWGMHSHVINMFYMCCYSRSDVSMVPVAMITLTPGDITADCCWPHHYMKAASLLSLICWLHSQAQQHQIIFRKETEQLWQYSDYCFIPARGYHQYADKTASHHDHIYA